MQRERLVIDDDLAKALADEAAADGPAFESRRVALASCLQRLGPEQRKLIVQRYEPNASRKPWQRTFPHEPARP